MSVDSYIVKLSHWEKELADNKTEAEQKKKSDPFIGIKESIYTDLHEVRQKQDERDQKETNHGRTTQVVTLCVEIRALIKKLEHDSKEMNLELRRSYNSAPKNDKMGRDLLKKREILFRNIKGQIDDVKDREEGLTPAKSSQIPTLEEFKAGGGGRVEKVTRINEPERDLTEEEKTALERWEGKKQEMNDHLVDINEGLEELEGRARNIGEIADDQQRMLHGANDDADRVNEKLTKLNYDIDRVLTSVGQIMWMKLQLNEECYI
mmetsp:Transcript_46225/g.53287  ORF Transcript_46225/g.53287 Transcript_46225/m.53287 type:complete len:264 (+) Transcript_46225:33-824(+)|eukprot:CAMPEP_0114976706 /NCGR_PEP_ID=MMETSP0216-20121206/2824_1 /TAXON_ID=223996 /ORGANISM="Protocruzia adherens, Strain Boccale" /LENGTH=263 /DNA_ID=CAMNT_0002337669 /DNA_START=33 /DNA_END=824 /DNA_ORIENTATION=+